MADAPAIGIDLGTTYSCVAVYQHNKVEVIANDQGKRITPSYVAFAEHERLIGDPAKHQLSDNPFNTVYDAKRLIGRRYDESTVAADMKHWPFKVTSLNNKPTIHLEYKGETKAFFPEEISSMVLTNMKETAEEYLAAKVEKAVISVPAYFNNAQRQATKDAAAIAGLNVLHFINEPTAAALAFGQHEKVGRNSLIYDLGGGTFDVSILTIEDGKFEVKSTAGDTHLGGQDFTNLLADDTASEFKKQRDVTFSIRSMCELRTACENAKLTLSTRKQAKIDVHLDGTRFKTTITRAKFEDLCSHLFQLTLEPVRQALQDADFGKDDIQNIVLVGGSTRIPKIKEILQDFFIGNKLKQTVNPDEAVAYGAALQAAKLKGDKSKEMQNMCLYDVTPLSLGTSIIGGLMSTIIKRNSPIPTKQTESFTTSSDNQDNILVDVYQGERPKVKDNYLLEKFTFNIDPAPCGVPSISITFDIDISGIINVLAVDKGTGSEKKMTITNVKGGLSKEDIKRMMEDAKKFQKEDEAERDRITARNALESYAYDMKANVWKEAISQVSKQKITDKCIEAIAWVKANESARKDEYEQKQKLLEGLKK